MTPDLPRAEAAIAEYLRALGIDPDTPELARTPERVARLGSELFAGIDIDPAPGLASSAMTEVGGAAVAFRDVPFRSTCEHHLLRFSGTVSIAYLPAGRIAGLGSIVTLIETVAARPQVQERFTEQVADGLEQGLGAAGVLVTASAEHECVAMRGPRIRGATVTTLVTRGVYATEAGAAEARALVGLA